MFVASCLFVHGFSRVAHITYGFDGLAQYSSSPHRTVFANFCQWDCGWYSRVVYGGYSLPPRNEEGQYTAGWAFFPLFPITIRALEDIVHIDPTTIVVITSKLEFFTAILTFLLWLRPYLEGLKEYFLAAAIVAFNPYLIYGHSGYSEPLYFTVCCLGFWALEQQKWILAGVFGAALSATRLVGLSFVVVYAIAAFRQLGPGALKDRSLRLWLGIVLCPLGLALFGIYLHHHVGDALAFAHVQSAWGRISTDPITSLVESIRLRGWFRIWALMGIAGLLLSAWLIWRRAEYGIFLAISILLPLSTGVTWSLARYMWWQPPLLLVIFLALRRSSAAQTLYFTCAGGMAAFMVITWFSGNNIVI